jgi:hypothetical protein
MDPLNVPASDGRFNEAVVITEGANSDSATDITPSVKDTSTVVVRAWDNSGPVYVGWSEEVDGSTGFPIKSGESLSVDLNTGEQSFYAVADNPGDSVRVIAIG